MRVSFIPGSPGPALLSTLGVLRRPASRGDRLANQSLAGTNDVYAGFVRRALDVRGVSYYVAAARNDSGAWLPSPRCFAMQTAAARAYARKIPAGVRAQTLALQAAFIAYDRRAAAQAPRDVVCLVSTARNGGGSECGVTTAAIRAGVAPSNDQGTFSGVVPDGVASVTLRFPAAGGRAADAVTATVTGNMYAVHVTGMSDAPPTEPTMIWRSADRRVLKTIPVATARYCRQHPLPCLAVAGSGVSEASSSSGTTPGPAPPRGAAHPGG
jgi:hypothetical protein